MKTICLFVAALLFTSVAQADTVQLKVGKRLARFAMLRPGTHRYVRYTVDAQGLRKLIDIWQRTISFAPATSGVPNKMHIVQRWDEADGKTVLIQDSWFDAGTFRPLTHVRHLEKGGKTSISGYRFGDSQVTGMTDLAENDRSDFVMELPEPSYNFEYDMELLQALPLKTGRTFDIPFYDAGIDKPGRYDFKVIGEQPVAGPGGRSIRCWVITADYNTGKIVSRFWLAKSSQTLIREEAVQPNGTLVIKALLLPESGDVRAS